MIHEGEVLGGTYQVIRQIGRGGTGQVFKAYHLNLRKYVVIKRVWRGTGNLEALRAETDVLKNLRHSNIPQVYDFLVREGEVFTVMDYIEGNDLDQLPAGTGRMSENYLVQLLLQLASVLSYLHRNKPPVIHSDIKPDNLILAKDGKLCLIDFNIAVTTGVADSLSGYSMHYASPEQYRRIMDIHAKAARITPLDPRSDIFSAGAVFYYLITGCYTDTRKPRNQKKDPVFSDKVRGFAGFQQARTLYSDMRRHGYSDALCHVVARCLEPDRHLRYPDGHALYHAVRHLRRQDKMYRRYVLLRAGSWLLSAALIGGGCWYLVKGKKQEVLDAWQTDMRSFITSYEKGGNDAQLIGNDLLNKSDYKEIREDHPEDVIMVLSCLGDAAEEKGDHENAEQYYEDALLTAQENHSDNSRMYRDYAMTLVENGYIARAEDVMRQNGSEDAGSLFIRACIDLQEGDANACIQKAEEILGTGADADLCADACVLAADACLKKETGSSVSMTKASDGGGTEEERVSWLERAVSWSGDIKYLRLLAGEYWKQVGDTRKTTYYWESCAGKAADCYEKICALPNARTDDVAGRVAAMQYLGNFSGTISLLQIAMEKDPSDYRLPAYLAIAYDAENIREEASRYAGMALELSEQTGGGTADNALLERVRAIM